MDISSYKFETLSYPPSNRELAQKHISITQQQGHVEDGIFFSIGISRFLKLEKRCI